MCVIEGDAGQCFALDFEDGLDGFGFRVFVFDEHGSYRAETLCEFEDEWGFAVLEDGLEAGEVGGDFVGAGWAIGAAVVPEAGFCCVCWAGAIWVENPVVGAEEGAFGEPALAVEEILFFGIDDTGNMFCKIDSETPSYNRSALLVVVLDVIIFVWEDPTLVSVSASKDLL